MNIQESNEFIITQVKSGDIQSFRKLVEKNQAYAFTVAFRILCNEEDAKDIVQECFIRVWKNIGIYNGQAKFTTWIFSIISHLCLDKLKANKRRNRVLINDLDKYRQRLKDNNSSIEAEFDNKELAVKIENISGMLKPKQRIVFVLRDLQNLNIDEVAKITGISINAVKTNLVYARRNIRMALEKLERGEK